MRVAPAVLLRHATPCDPCNWEPIHRQTLRRVRTLLISTVLMTACTRACTVAVREPWQTCPHGRMRGKLCAKALPRGAAALRCAATRAAAAIATAIGGSGVGVRRVVVMHRVPANRYAQLRLLVVLLLLCRAAAAGPVVQHGQHTERRVVRLVGVQRWQVRTGHACAAATQAKTAGVNMPVMRAAESVGVVQGPPSLTRFIPFLCASCNELDPEHGRQIITQCNLSPSAQLPGVDDPSAFQWYLTRSAL